MRRGLLYAKMFDLPVIAHCEDSDLRGSGVMNYGKTALRLGLPGIPDVAEDIVIARDLLLAHQYLMRIRGLIKRVNELQEAGDKSANQDEIQVIFLELDALLAKTSTITSRTGDSLTKSK